MGAKAEALRIKKKLEGEIHGLEIALDHANKANNEAQKSIKRYQGQFREAECAYAEESRVRQEMAEKASLAERRANALAGEMEEARSLLDSAERGKRQTEAELGEARTAVNEMSSINSKASAEKRAVEQLSILCMLRLMIYFTKPRILKKRLKRLWVMLLVLQMSFVQSRITPMASQRQKDPWSLGLVNLRISLLKPMRMPRGMDVQPWQNLKQGSESLK